MLSVVVQMAPLTECGEIEQRAVAVRHVEHMRHGQNDFASGYRMRLSVVSAAPLAAIACPIESHKAAAQLPVGWVTGVITRHSRFAHFDAVAREQQLLFQHVMPCLI